MTGGTKLTISAGSGLKRLPDPFVLVIFGASGDLTRRKLVPALCSLCADGLLPEQAKVVGFARSDHSDASFREHLRSAMPARHAGGIDAEACARFAARLHYHRGDYDDASSFDGLRRRLEALTAEAKMPLNALFYLSTPPEQFLPITRQLGAAGLTRKGAAAAGRGWSRVIVEKPFGRDLRSAIELNAGLAEVLDESQVYRIDHYLGKEVVQNLLVLRFANSIFEPIWNHKYVDHVQITAAETLGAGTRGSTYDRSGALRDMVQNHMMNLLCLVAMEVPASLAADAIRNEKVKVLQALRPIPPDCADYGVVRAQYAAGQIDGQPAPGYLDEPGVAAGSTTETYVAFKAYVDNWRWAGVPFYLRTGKRMAERVTQIAIHFRPVPQVLFNAPPHGPMRPNVLVVRIQPDEGISMRFQVKRPGAAMRVEPAPMDFGYAGAFGADTPDAYERLLLDAAVGDSTLFIRSDEIEAAWRFVNPILDGCDPASTKRLPSYPAGTWGPAAGEKLIAADGNRWHT